MYLPYYYSCLNAELLYFLPLKSGNREEDWEERKQNVNKSLFLDSRGYRFFLKISLFFVFSYSSIVNIYYFTKGKNTDKPF